MFRKAKNILAGVILAATPLFTLLMPGIAHAATFTCTWTGAVDNNFSTAGNWSGCNGTSPQLADTDDLVFPVSATNLTPNNDLAGATFNSITFNGTGTGGYTLSGGAFTLAGNITDSSSQANTIGNNVTVSGASTIDVATSSMVHFTGAVSGSGSITKAGAGTLTFDNLTLTGALTVNAGRLEVFATSAADATVSGVTVASGATFAYDAFTNSAVTTYTFSKPITSAGTLDLQGSGTNLTLNLTGTITLTGDTTIITSSGETVHIQGPLHGPGFTLLASGTGVVLNESTDNTTNTPSGDISGAGAAADGGVTAPDTGFAMVSAHPGVTLAVTLASAAAIFTTARMTRKSASRR
jgi:autotransporter-associated beta strand protein